MKNGSILKALSAVFLLFIIFNIFAFLTTPFLTSSGKDLNFTEFIGMTRNGKIKEVTIADNKIWGWTDKNERFRTYAPVQYQGLANELVQNGVRIIAQDNSGNPLINFLFFWGPIILIIGFIIFMSKKMRNGLGQIPFAKAKTKLASANNKKVTFADVAGVDEAKTELQETVEFLKNPQKFTKLGGRLPKGVMLMGPPGTGKTLLARAVAGEANVPFFAISGSEFIEMFVGVGASRVRDLFNQGKANAPCIIFIDEIDAVGRQRGTGISHTNDEREQTLHQLLTEMDGFEGNAGVIVIAASNRPDVLDPALLRPGRFDRRVVVDRPDVRGREEILKIHSRSIPLAEGVKLADIAKGTSGFSGADLANLINEATLNASRYDQQTVTQKDVEFAKDKILMGSERRTMVISDQEKNTIAIHEAGHALLALLMPDSDPLHKITIIPRGMALGRTEQLPSEDHRHYSKNYLISQLAILMGGRCAEEVILGQQTTGAQNDIEGATEIARRMVCEWGMSELDPMSFSTQSENPFLGKQMTERSWPYSEETANQIDNQTKLLIRNAYDTAKKIIEAHKKSVIKLSEALIVKETVDGDEARRILGLPG